MEYFRRRGLAQKLRDEKEHERLMAATIDVDAEHVEGPKKGVCSKCGKYIGRGIVRHEAACK